MKDPLSRRLFFYFLIFSFFINTSFVLTLAFGYRFDWSRGIFVHTGSITIKPNPLDIKIKLNEKDEKDIFFNRLNNRYEITGLFPGIYKIEISADGFYTWSKSVPVHSGLSTELWNVLLVKENYEKRNFTVPEIQNFFPAPKEFAFAYVSKKNDNFLDLEIGVIDTEKNEILNKINLKSGRKLEISLSNEEKEKINVIESINFTNNKFENIEWSPDNSSLVVPVIHRFDQESTCVKCFSKEIKDYLIFDLKNNNYFYLSEKLKETSSSQLLDLDNQNTEFSSVRWSPKEENSLYFIFNNKLYLISLDLKEKKILNETEIYSETLAYDFADDGIYILNKNGSVLYNRDFKINELKELTKFQIENSSVGFRLNAYDNERIILLNNKTGDFYLYNKNGEKNYSKKLSSEIIDAHFSDDGKKLVYYSISDIYVYFTRIWNAQPTREENRNESVTRSFKKIDNVHFAKDYEHIIFSTENEIKIIEIDDRGKNNPQTIINLKGNTTKIISDHRNDLLYFLDETENKNNNLFEIKFPEKIPLFDLIN